MLLIKTNFNLDFSNKKQDIYRLYIFFIKVAFFLLNNRYLRTYTVAMIDRAVLTTHQLECPNMNASSTEDFNYLRIQNLSIAIFFGLLFFRQLELQRPKVDFCDSNESNIYCNKLFEPFVIIH